MFCMRRTTPLHLRRALFSSGSPSFWIRQRRWVAFGLGHTAKRANSPTMSPLVRAPALDALLIYDGHTVPVVMAVP